MASGRPDWYSSIAMHGKHLTDYVCVAVDAAGNMLGIMQGWDGAALQPIAVDGAGVMKANLVLQDLSFLTVRPAYGSAIRVADGIAVPDSVETELWLVNHQGALIDGIVYALGDPDYRHVYLRIRIDGNLVLDNTFQEIMTFGASGRSSFRMSMIYFALVGSYVAGFNQKLTFETSFSIHAYHELGADVAVNWDCCYALTP